jgi:hypothetical protein
MQDEQDNRPKGIGFYSVETGETRYAVLDAQIQGYINSSDLGINASRGQDFGWRLSADWVKRVRAFRADENKMQTLSAKLRLEDDQLPSLTQVLYAIYGQELRAAQSRAQANERPFEEEYLQSISSDGKAPSADPLDRYGEDGSATEELVPQEEPASEEVPHVPAASPDQPSMPTAPVESETTTKPKTNKKSQ